MLWPDSLTTRAFASSLVALTAVLATLHLGCGSSVDEAGGGGADATGGDGSTAGAGQGTGSGGAIDPIETGDVPVAFSLLDENTTSLTAGESVSPRDYLEAVSGWYFGHAT